MAFKYVYGPIASRRLGKSLGISPVSDNRCNFMCVYCQLGKIKPTESKRAIFDDTDALLKEVDEAIKTTDFDVISLVGDGEPLLNQDLGRIIRHIKTKTKKPLALITNGSLFYDENVLEAIKLCDIVLPSLDAYDEASFKRINRPVGGVKFSDFFKHLKAFTKEFPHQIYLEMMLVRGFNDDQKALEAFKGLLKELRYDKLYLNTVVRPPLDSRAQKVKKDTMQTFSRALGGIALDYLSQGLYLGADTDTYQALLALLKRHPLNHHEIKAFLTHRKENSSMIFNKLHQDKTVEVKTFSAFDVYTIKKP